MTTLTYSGRLVVEVCWCGIAHAIPETLARQASEQGHRVYCPLGHVWVVKDPEVAKLRRQLDWANARVRQERDQREATQRSLAATKGVLTKTRRRVANGVCPCCKRHFTNLERHMKGQHPEYSEQDRLQT